MELAQILDMTNNDKKQFNLVVIGKNNYICLNFKTIRYEFYKHYKGGVG